MYTACRWSLLNLLPSSSSSLCNVHVYKACCRSTKPVVLSRPTDFNQKIYHISTFKVTDSVVGYCVIIIPVHVVSTALLLHWLKT